MRILVLNGNTTQAITDTVAAAARAHASPGTEIVPATAPFGVAVVSTAAENAVAGHAVLEALAAHPDVDAAILAISFDTALEAAQELMPFPVVGMTAAALHTACLVGRRFGMVTFGASSRAMYLDQVRDAGFADRMVGCETVALASAAAYRDTGRLEQGVLDAASRLHGAGAASVVIAGAATAGLAGRLQPRAPVHLLDGMACAVRLAEAMVRLGARPARATPLPKDVGPTGIGPALAALLHGGG